MGPERAEGGCVAVRPAGARQKTETKSADQTSVKPIPMTSRRGLFILSLCVLAAWVAVLLWMYFTTVYPHRQEHAPATRKVPVLALSRSR